MPLVIYDFATAFILNFLINEDNFILFFYQCTEVNKIVSLTSLLLYLGRKKNCNSLASKN